MTEPIFWLVCSLLLVAVCLTAVLVAAIPALLELARASRSAEKLFDTLYRELPPTLEAIRLTGMEITDLTGELSEGVEGAGKVVKQVDQGLRIVQRQVQGASTTTRSILAGAQAAWNSLTRSTPKSLGTSNGHAKTRLTDLTESAAADSDLSSLGEHLRPQPSEQTPLPRQN